MATGFQDVVDRNPVHPRRLHGNHSQMQLKGAMRHHVSA